MATKSKVIFESPPGVFRVNLNDLEQGGEGGRISLVTDASENDHLSEEEKITGVTVLLNYRKDKPMEAWPKNRAEMEKRRFTVRITEEAPAK